jgi:hypothetical protein
VAVTFHPAGIIDPGYNGPRGMFDSIRDVHPA